jgi:hypothetical protein
MASNFTFDPAALLKSAIAHGVPLINKASNGEKLTAQDYIDFGVSTALGYLSVGGHQPDISDAGRTVHQTFSALNEVTKNQTPI